MKFYILFFFIGSITFLSCKKTTPTKANSKNTETPIDVKYAKNFKILKAANYTKISIKNLNKTTHYYLYNKKLKNSEPLIKESEELKIIPIPLENIVLTSTTDVPLLEALNLEEKLIGFPEPKYISSHKTRQRITNGLIENIGSASNLNTEIILNLKPETVVAFSISNDQKGYELIEKSGIPVLMNSSWLENHPLGRAEWIKVFGLLFDKEKEANEYFSNIETAYNKALQLAKTATNKPTVLSGNMYKDVWYVPGGKSYMAKLIEDANGNYLWNDNTDTGSLSLSFESVYDKASKANIWIGGGRFNSVKELINFEEKYKLFDAANSDQVYSKDIKKGPSGGVIYYEQGSLHADWVLLDLIKIFHPNLVPDYSFHFYQKLK